jgi:3-deoxy-manno-octulosonate cytidylyltransferase (CMP-KDO synthetase)
MKVLAVIPSRYDSQRFPGKSLVDILGKPMIQRVYEQVIKADSVSKVIVATDDIRIFTAVNEFGGEVILTRADHISGTDRCAEAIEKIEDDFDVVINVQGDEPFIQPEQIYLIAGMFNNPDVKIATLVRPSQPDEQVADPSKVKVVLDKHHRVMLFSRSVIPFTRDVNDIHTSNTMMHLGIYGFRTEILTQVAKLKPCEIEATEKLEQLRWMWHGFPIHAGITEHASIGIDTPEDLKNAIKLFKDGGIS